MIWDQKKHRILKLLTQQLSLGTPTSNVLLTATGDDLNLLSGLVASGQKTKRVAKVAAVAAAGNGGVLAWANPHAGAIDVTRVAFDVTTVATGACTVDVGVAANGTTSNDTLMDGLDVNAAAGLFDNIINHGTNGLSHRRVAAGSFVTGTVASGTVTGLVGSFYIEYQVL
jgi:hypothetical protein